MWRDRKLFLAWVFCLSVDYAQPKQIDENPFDLLIFSQQWPQTVCTEWKKSNREHNCTMPTNQNSWTIHGVWPSKLHTIGPAFCNRSWHFDPEAMKPIETPMIEFWTNIEGEPNTYDLWYHEWSKHGTCATVLEPLNSEFKYFNNALNWMKQFNMFNILNEDYIVPSNDRRYPIKVIHRAVLDKLHVNPAFVCRKINGISWIVKIMICFNKALHLTDCDRSLLKRKYVPYNSYLANDILTNCDTHHDILYPKDVFEDPPYRIIVQLYNAISWLQWFTCNMPGIFLW